MWIFPFPYSSSDYSVLRGLVLPSLHLSLRNHLEDVEYNLSTLFHGEIVKINISIEPLIKEYIWVWPDELGYCFLDDKEANNETIGNEFLRLLSIEKEKARRMVFKAGKEAKPY